jgi:hypothetical protein
MTQILYAYEDELGLDCVASLDFWGRPPSPSNGGGPQHSMTAPIMQQIENGGL